MFKSLKDSFAKAVRALSFRVVKRPLDQAFSITNIKSGFSKCGIYPFSPDAVAKNKMIPSAVHRSSSDTCSDCAPESSASESAVSSSNIPSSLESPSNHITSGGNVSQEIVIATPSSVPSVAASVDVAATPPPVNTSRDASTTDSPSSGSRFSPVNPLVVAGLVPEDLSDILVTPSSDAAVAKKRTKRILGARHLTSDEYIEMLKNEEKKKKRR